MAISSGFQILVRDRVTGELLIEIKNEGGTDEAEAMMKHVSAFITRNYPDAAQAVGGDFREAIEFRKGTEHG